MKINDVVYGTPEWNQACANDWKELGKELAAKKAQQQADAEYKAAYEARVKEFQTKDIRDILV